MLRQAKWPAVNCHQLYSESVIDRPIKVAAGHAAVPEEPGLGVGLNEDVVERLRVEKPAARPEPDRLIETSWPDGRKMYFASNGEVNFMLREGIKGSIPYFTRGVKSRPLENDGAGNGVGCMNGHRRGPFLLGPKVILPREN